MIEQDKNQADDLTPRTVGLECPSCGCMHFWEVKKTIPQAKRVIRRRECRHCGRRVTTSEKIIGA